MASVGNKLQFFTFFPAIYLILTNVLCEVHSVNVCSALLDRAAFLLLNFPLLSCVRHNQGALSELNQCFVPQLPQ